MRLFYSIEIFCISILLSFPVCLHAQGWHAMSVQQIDSIVNPPLLKQASGIIRLDSIVSHIGQMTEDDSPVYVNFGFTNISDTALVITRVRTDCGCTDSHLDKVQYAPDEKGLLTIKYTPKNHPGTIDASAFVYSSLSDVYPIAKITLLGNVLPGKDVWDRYRYSIGCLKLKQKKVVFHFDGQKKLTERILCGNSGTEDIKLHVRNLPDYVEFSTEPEVITPGGEADIIIRVDATALDTSGRQTIPLELQGIPSGQGKDGKLILQIN